MACEVIQSWTFAGLVGAFLDLGIAYLLLCGSTIAYLASKFLGVFGLSLPCPCDGLFGNPSSDYCLQRVLRHYPAENISSVQLSVRSKFPYDSMWVKHQTDLADSELIKHRNYENAQVEVKGEASCSFISERDSVLSNEMSVADPKKNGYASQSPGYGLRHRRKTAVGHEKVLSDDHFQSDKQDVSQPSLSFNKWGIENAEGSFVLENCGDGTEALVGTGLLESVAHGFESNELNENRLAVDKVAVDGCTEHDELGSDINEKGTISVLKQALEEEHAVQTALYLDLEKERSAAASAADEAMAMILRLQEEKALIEMEARQFKRIIEDKYAYDAEEMNILKEILVRRERETHFLEKEVEAYRQMIFGNEQLDADILEMGSEQGEKASSSLNLREDPELMLQRISESIGHKEMVKNAINSECEITSIKSQNHTLAFEKELPMLNLDGVVDSSKLGDIHRHGIIEKTYQQFSSSDEINLQFQEKGMVSIDANPYVQETEMHLSDEISHFNQSRNVDGLNLDEKTIIPIGDEQEQSDCSLHQGLLSKKTDLCYESKIVIPTNSVIMEKHRVQADQGSEDPCCIVFDTQPQILDVHAIDESHMSQEASGMNREGLSGIDTLNLPRKCDGPTASGLETEIVMKRTSSDMASRKPPLACSRTKAWGYSLRRNSMSAVDYERLKIDNEVGCLRERLRTVQEGRQKLNFSMGDRDRDRDREKIQLQLLEDIACQLREIRQLTEPGKAIRQASLPPQSTKVITKKKSWRSVSLGIEKSLNSSY